MISASKFFCAIVITACFSATKVQAINLNDGNLDAPKAKTTNPLSFTNLSRTLGVSLASIGGAEGFFAPVRFTARPYHTGNAVSKYSAFSQKNLNEADAIALANERYATIGSSYKQHLKEQTGPGTLSDALKILVPTVVTELALFTSAYQHLSPVEMLLGGGLGYLFADLEVGLYHFAMDKLDWTSPKISSEVRKNVIFFNLHHDDPAGCTKHSYWGLTRASYILNFIFIAGAGISSLSGHPLLSCV